MTDKEAMAMALDALETLMIEHGSIYEKAIAALKERLAQPEPIQSLQCFHCQVTIETLNDKVMHLLAQRKPLTEEQIWKAIRPLATTDQLCKKLIDISMDEYRAIEVAHGIKENT
jgi:hypothetical protein